VLSCTVRVTIDTNVLFAALKSRSGASHYILRLIIAEKIQLAVSVSTFLEYWDVLSRQDTLEQVELNLKDIEDILDLLVLLAQKQNIYFLQRPNLIDEKDNMFIECAFASQSEYLITSNTRDFISGELESAGFKVITPGEFVQLWRQENE